MKYKLEFIVFGSGLVVMVLELVGSRILAPYLGTSLYVWTSLIGVILGALSIGYAWGGRMADRNANYKVFSTILLLGAIFIGLIDVVNAPLLVYLHNSNIDIRLSSILASVFILGPASVLLGMISPYAVRLRILGVATSGRVVGNLYAISTVGSIAGTFLAGFVLIAYLGTRGIVLILALIVVLLSILADSRNWMAAKLGVLVALAVGLLVLRVLRAEEGGRGFVDIDSSYNRIWIDDGRSNLNGRTVRSLLVGGVNQSAMYLDNPRELVFEYTKMYRLAGHFVPDPKRALMIGGGGYSYPRDFLQAFPESEMDVVEIDPVVTDVARRYFGLHDESRLQIYHQDGRTFLNADHEKYDVVFGDAFGSNYSIPAELTTREAIGRISDLLNDNGVAVVNIISAVEGRKGEFLRAEYRTFREVFGQVYIFLTNPGGRGSVQNVILVALKSDDRPSFENMDPEIKNYLGRMWRGEIPIDMPVLTDDYAPVDRYLAEMLY